MSARQRVVRRIYPFGAVRQVLRGPARGMRFVVEPGIGFNYAVGSEAAAPRFFKRLVHPGAIVCDVGANKGQMALIFAALVGSTGRVVALEPAPAEFASLCRNLSLNTLHYVRPVQVAAFDRQAVLAFTHDADRPTQGKLAEVERGYVIPNAEVIGVEAAPLDDVLTDEERPDFIKIDVEGAAARVLRGAARLLDDLRPSVYVELHGPEEQAGVRDELLARGYIARTATGERVDDPTDAPHSALWCEHPDRAQGARDRRRPVAR